jgi:hypothetical protein
MLTLILPPMAALDQSAAELVAAAGDDRAIVNATNKAIWFLGEGLDIRPTARAFLVPSGTRGGTVHRIDHVSGCSCEAGRAGRVCWHKQAIAIVEQAQTRIMPALPLGDRLAAARKATALLNELFA